MKKKHLTSCVGQRYFFLAYKPYPGVRVRIPYTFRTRTHVRVRERNVNGSIFKSSTGTERKRVDFKNKVRVRNVEGFFSKRWCVNGSGTDMFQKLSTGTGSSTEVGRN